MKYMVCIRDSNTELMKTRKDYAKGMEDVYNDLQLFLTLSYYSVFLERGILLDYLV